MAIDAQQYKICQQRQHDSPRPQGFSLGSSVQSVQNQMMQAAQSSVWQTCRWCGMRYQEAMVPTQIENPDDVATLGGKV